MVVALMSSCKPMSEPTPPDALPEVPAGGKGAVRKDATERRCLASGEVRPKGELIRFVVGPDGGVVPDVDERLPGRGLWLTARRDMIDLACARKLFAKAARAPARAPADLADRVERLLRRRCLDLLGLARRCGAVAGGFDAVSACLGSGAAALLLQAKDAAEGGRGKLRAVARAHDVPVAEVFSAEELGRALGREALVHVALTAGGIAARLRVELARLDGVRRPAPQASPARAD
jgi:predicted RNA-binding protein YlxR (DUF448 family)